MQMKSTVIAADPASDLAAVSAMARQLQDYILGDEVYRTIVIATDRGEERIQTSGGDLLARLHKLHAQVEQLTPEQRRTLQEAQAQVDHALQVTRDRFLALLVREAKVRLNSLRWFLDDCEESPQTCRTQYPFEIRNRQRVAEIGKVLRADAPEGLEAQIEAIDRRLRHITDSADFVWDDRVRHVYPKSEYWYLYARPQG